jgi:hypothetical protein
MVDGQRRGELREIQLGTLEGNSVEEDRISVLLPVEIGGHLESWMSRRVWRMFVNSGRMCKNG